MKQKYLRFYNWYSSRKILKYAIAFFIVLFSYFLYFWTLADYRRTVPKGFMFDILEGISNLSSQLLSELYLYAPYIILALLFIVFLLYKNILLKIAMTLICLWSLFFQFGLLMGFRSYFDFLYFLPQIILIAAGVFALIKTKKWRLIDSIDNLSERG